jgi:hypothetical protein
MGVAHGVIVADGFAINGGTNTAAEQTITRPVAW